MPIALIATCSTHSTCLPSAASILLSLDRIIVTTITIYPMWYMACSALHHSVRILLRLLWFIAIGCSVYVLQAFSIESAQGRVMYSKNFLHFAQCADLCPGLLTADVVENSIRSTISGAASWVGLDTCKRAEQYLYFQWLTSLT